MSGIVGRVSFGPDPGTQRAARTPRYAVVTRHRRVGARSTPDDGRERRQLTAGVPRCGPAGQARSFLADDRRPTPDSPDLE
ncbi:hypothetical protein ACJ6WF_39720 [Streptomyces sp. MMS24-I2-30]|uniref:hypothetical protein n=1 Tax=Streptomyces sp. MMS24-I2-30 TaxID=3351564 RepID=UPI003896E2F2